MKQFTIILLCFILKDNLIAQKYGLDLNISSGYHFYDNNTYPKDNQIPFLFELKISEKSKNAGIGLMPIYSFIKIKNDPFPPIASLVIPNSFAQSVEKEFWHGLNAKSGGIGIAIPIFIGFRLLNKKKFQVEARLSLIKNFEIWQYGKGLFQYYQLDTTIKKYRYVRDENLDWQKFEIRNGFTLAYLGIAASFKMTDEISLRLLLQYNEDLNTLFKFDRSHQYSFFPLFGISYNLKEERNRHTKYKRRK